MANKNPRHAGKTTGDTVIRPHRIIAAQFNAVSHYFRNKLQTTLFRLKLQRKAIFLFAFVLLIVIFNILLPGRPRMVSWYSREIFGPFQNLRNLLFGYIPFSIGDLLYVTGIILLLSVLIRWFYFLFHLRSQARYLGASVLSFINVVAFCYAIFFLGWGGNYFKPQLTRHWALNTENWQDTSSLFQFDAYLIQRLNELAPGYTASSFKAVNKDAKLAFRKHTNSKTRLHGLSAKPSMFGYFMQYLGIQGYYNPFTGEAQVNRFLPSYMLPFVVCHEMAHQSGIAAEGDANLLSYALCTRSAQADFAYSGYFNIWLYTHNRALRTDSAKAMFYYDQLNLLSRQHVDTLRAIRRQYKGIVNQLSGELYDSYLRWHNQKEGIESYSKVIKSAWAYEQKFLYKKEELLQIP